MLRQLVIVLFCVLYAAAMPTAAHAQQDGRSSPSGKQRTNADTAQRHAELEAALMEMLSGATLEGSYTSTGPGSDPTRLSRDKYTLGDVRKVGGNLWLIPARIQYAEHDVTLPITVPIHWAADTPVIVVDNLGLPPFGAVSARVMFFGGHYAGYWQHGEHGGHLFGVIKPREKVPASGDSPAGQQVKQ